MNISDISHNTPITHFLRESILENNRILLNHQSNYLYSLQLLEQNLPLNNPSGGYIRNLYNAIEEEIDSVDMSYNNLPPLLPPYGRSGRSRPRSRGARSTQSTQSTQFGDRVQDYVISYIFEPLVSTTVDNLQNVVVRPSREDIENATRLITYNSSDLHLNTECPITLERFEDGEEVRQIIFCEHIFKESSLMNWFGRNVRCPLCRYDIRNNSVPPSVSPLSDLVIDISNIPMVSSLPAPRYRYVSSSVEGESNSSSNIADSLLNIFQTVMNSSERGRI